MPSSQAFIDQYVKLLIIQYCDKSNAIGEISATIGSWSKTFLFLNSFIDEFDLDQAYGDRLDIIGRIVGVKRLVAEGVAKKYFGFSGTTNALKFGEGPFFSIVKDSGFTETELNDTQFRFFIRSKISKNISSSYMVNDERQSLQTAIQFLFKNRAFCTDNKDMTLTIYVDESFPEVDLTLIIALDLIPLPQGVRIKCIVEYSSNNTFGFSGNSNAKGFGAGKFARIIS